MINSGSGLNNKTIMHDDVIPIIYGNGARSDYILKNAVLCFVWVWDHCCAHMYNHTIYFHAYICLCPLPLIMKCSVYFFVNLTSLESSV